jgi:hypothetical protein
MKKQGNMVSPKQHDNYSKRHNSPNKREINELPKKSFRNDNF